MSQNGFQKLRQQFAQQARRQQLEKRFGQKRKQRAVQLQEQQKQIFENLLPNIDDQTFQENRLVLSDYARSSTYSYQILPLVGYAYEYILRNPYDKYSWQIITYLSFYDDFQIPQTQQFVDCLVNYWKQEPFLISQLMRNLSKLSRYNLLCCRLVDRDIVYEISKQLSKLEQVYYKQSINNKSGLFAQKQDMQLEIFNYLRTLSNIFTIQPCLQINIMRQICDILRYENKSSRFLRDIHIQSIFTLISNITQNLSHMKQVIFLTREVFEQKICNYFNEYQEQSIKFMSCCIKNHIQLSVKLVQKLYGTINSNKSKNKMDGLKQMLKLLNYNFQIQKMEVEGNQVTSLKDFINNKVMVSFQQFSSLYSFSNPVNQISQFDQQNDRTNTLMFYSILFNQDYQNKFKLLTQIYLNSNSDIKEQILKFIHAIILSIIRQIQNYEPKRLTQPYQDYFIPEDMQQFLYPTVNNQNLFYMISQSLQIHNNQAVVIALQIVMDLLAYFRQNNQEFQQNSNSVNIHFILNQLYKTNIVNNIENLQDYQSKQVHNLAIDILQIIDSFKN